MTAIDPNMRVKCEICGAQVHSIQRHLSVDHADLSMTIADYQAKFPGMPILSEIAAQKLAEAARAKAAAPAEAPVSTDPSCETKLVAFNELFGLGKAAAAMSAKGKPIPITVMGRREHDADLIAGMDPNYVFNVDVLKNLMMGIEMRIPIYLWGHAGTGKTTMFEQISARTSRPMVRVQHTANMEEEHIVGGWRLRDGKTIFEPGLLPLAMMHGWLYVADEYDFGRPEVLSVYQPVLEMKPLVIKEADTAHRVIKPHPQFRIVATGNTNGQGDETGLYQGTNMQNAANYERFGIVEQMPYMDAKLEAKMISLQADIPQEDATKLVDFATRIRQEFDGGKVGMPISPRSLLYAAKVGVARMNYRAGIEKAFINRLSSVDRETATQVAQRVFG
jgi:cobaltochelatase CobS